MNSLLTVNEISEFLSLHPKTVYKLATQRKIPHVKRRGLGIRFRLEEVEEWLDKASFIQPDLGPVSGFSKRLDITAEDYDRLYLKGDSAVSSKKQRWNYGDYGVFVRKTGSGSERWYGWHYVERNGKRKRVKKVIRGAPGREEAVFVARERAVEAFRSAHSIEKEKKEISFLEFSKVYLKEHIEATRKNWKSDSYRLERAAEYFGDLELRSITRSAVARFRDSRLKAGNSKSTANRYMALLKKMFNLAVEEGYADSNAASGIKFFSEVDTVRTRVLSSEEERRLLSESSRKLEAVIQVALHTGMRQSEILSLEWENVDFSRKTVKVERTKSKRARFIPLNSVLCRVLSDLKRESRGEGLVFCCRSVRTAFEKTLKRARVKALTFHDLRRTFGTRLLERGVDIVTIQKLYGHSSVQVTERYLHPQDKASVEAVELLSPESESKTEGEAVLTRICPRKSEGKGSNLPKSLFSVN